MDETVFTASRLANCPDSALCFAVDTIILSIRVVKNCLCKNKNTVTNKTVSRFAFSSITWRRRVNATWIDSLDKQSRNKRRSRTAPADAVSYQENSRIVIQKSHHVTISPRLESAKGKRVQRIQLGAIQF